jgi:N-acetylneuraminate lyase
MTQDGKINVSAIPAIVERLIAHNISGIYICGSTGEGHSLSVRDRKLVTESFIQAVNGRMKIIINVGHNSIEDACDLTRHARFINADAISAAPPVYYKLRSEDQLIKTFEKITAEAPEIPFYYYHIPAMTGFKFDMEEFLRLSFSRLPSLQGIKFTSPDIHEYQSCLNMSGGKYQILYGMDEMLLSGLAAGAECMIGSTYNFMAPLYHEIMENFKKGDLKSAAQHQLEAVKNHQDLPKIRFPSGPESYHENGGC